MSIQPDPEITDIKLPIVTDQKGAINGKKVSLRCPTCKKKVLLVAQAMGTCRECNQIYCEIHRMPETHGCGDAVKASARQGFKAESSMKTKKTGKFHFTGGPSGNWAY